MKFIKNLHDRVNFAIKKGLTGYYAPQKISDEVHAESLNLWRKYIEDFEKNQTMDVYLRVFQNLEVVKLVNGIGNYLTQDYIYLMEGVIPANFSNAVIINGNTLNVGSNSQSIVGNQSGFQYWILLNTTSYATNAQVTVQLDGTTIYSGVVTNELMYIPYNYIQQQNLTFIVSGASVTFSLWQITIAGNNTEIKWVENEKFLYRANHPVKGPTATYPIGSNFNQGIQVLPTNAFNYMILSTLKRPTKPVYAFTQSGDRYIYDDTNSIDFEWNESVHDVIMERTLANLGINMRSPELIQFSNSQRQLEQQK